LNTWRKVRSQILVLSLLFGDAFPPPATRLSPNEYLRARIHTSQIDPRTPLFVLAVTVGNFSVVLAYCVIPQ
jgi:hypothetical protein